MDTVPFTVLDAQIALFTVDGAGNGQTQLYLGGSAEKVTMQSQYKERVLQYPGNPFGTAFHEDEDHAVDLQNVWLHDRSTGTARMPQGFQRNLRLLLVIVWYDREAAVWCNRTYVGVTGRSQEIEGANTYQTLKYRAESKSESSGTGVPSVIPLVNGQVRYVTGLGAMLLYRYAPGGSYTAVDGAALGELATIDLAVAGQCSIRFGTSSPVLVATAAALTVGSFTAGSTVLNTVPRLEWWLDGKRTAALSATGVLAVMGLTVANASPGVASTSTTLAGFSRWLATPTRRRLSQPNKFMPRQTKCGKKARRGYSEGLGAINIKELKRDCLASLLKHGAMDQHGFYGKRNRQQRANRAVVKKDAKP